MQLASIASVARPKPSDFPLPSPGGPWQPGWAAMYAAVHANTPQMFTLREDELLTGIALRGGADPATIGALLRSTYQSTPNGFDLKQNLLVLAAATLTNHGDAANVTRTVYNAAPAAFDADQNAALLAAALLVKKPAEGLANIVRTTYSLTPPGWSPSQNASAVLGALLAQDPSRAAEGHYRWLLETLAP